MTPLHPVGVATLRIMHVHTFYPDAVDKLYLAHPPLKRAAFKTQMDAAITDGFSAAHIFTPYLEDLGYETLFIVADNVYAQAQWLKEHGLGLENEKDWVREIVRKQIAAFKPDILYTCNPVLFDSAFIRTLPHRPRLIMGWRGADIDDTMDWSDFDLILSGLPLLLEKAADLGAKQTAFFFPGFPERFLEHISDTTPRFDVVFTGSWTNTQHATRNALMTHIAHEAGHPGQGYSCAFHLAGNLSALPQSIKPYLQDAVFGLDMHRAMRRGRIVFDARANHKYRGKDGEFDIGGSDTVNMRIFEALGSGCFLLTEHFDGLSNYFEPGKELATYRDKHELIEKIRYYLDHPDEREAIARRGQERCLRDYNMPQRAKAFDQIIRQHLSTKEQPSIAKPGHPMQQNKIPPQPARAIHGKTQRVDRLLRNAIATFKTGNYAGAFHAATQAKALRLPVLNIDYMRAACLLHLGKPIDAREALREELHYFPGNENAQVLLKEVLNIAPDTHRVNDSEFQEVLQLIRPHTMMPEARLYSLYTLAKRVCIDDIPGNFVECGVARGGATAMLGLIIKRYSKRPRQHFGFDSFEGMPAPTAFDTQNGISADETGWGTGTCAGSMEGVQIICDTLGVSSNVTLVKGYFEHTLATWKAPVGEVALLHLDADWYASTMTILNEFYDQVVSNGFLQFDDYGCWEGCKKAVDEFQQTHNLSFDLQPVPGDGQGIWMQKPIAQSSQLTPQY